MDSAIFETSHPNHFFKQSGFLGVNVNFLNRDTANTLNSIKKRESRLSTFVRLNFNERDALSRLGNDKQLLAFVVQTYLNELPAYLDELSKSMASKDPSQVGKAAHRLKGASATIGLECVASLALALEQAGKSNEPLGDLLAKHSQLVEHLSEKAKPTLTGWLANQ